MNVMLSCAGHNLRLILRQLRIFCLRLLGWIRVMQVIELIGEGDAALLTRIKQCINRQDWLATESISTPVTV